MDMFPQMKIAVIVANRYVFWAAGMPKILSKARAVPQTQLGSLQRSPDPPSAVCRYI